MRADDRHDEDAQLELTPAQRLQSLAELLVIGLQRLRKRPQIPSEIAEIAETGTFRIPHE